MNDTNEDPTEIFTYKFHELGEEMALEETELKWVVKVFGRQAWCEETYAQTLEEPAEYASQDEFDHVELTLELNDKIILRNEDWTEWNENFSFQKVQDDIEKIDWSTVY